MLAEHHADSFRISSLYAESSPLCISPTTVVSSANFMKELEGWMEVHTYVYRVYRRGLSMQPCGKPVLRIVGGGTIRAYFHSLRTVSEEVCFAGAHDEGNVQV